MDAENDASNVKVLVQRIMSYSLHCDSSKKLGAAFIFNNIYTVLREEDTLFNLYWMEILYAFVMSLEMIGTNLMEDSCFLEQIDQALNHVQRGFVEKSDRFNKSDTNRRLPPHFQGTMLKDVADFLFKHTGSKNPHCRTKCMQMFSNVRPLIANYDTLHITDSIENFYELEVEKPLHEELFDWLHDFHRSLDGYHFILQNHSIVMKSDKFLGALKYFFNNVAQKDIKQIIPKTFFTVTERQAFNSLKLQIVVKAIDFVIILLKEQCVPQQLWEECLPDLVCSVVFDPQCLGMEMSSLNKQSTLDLLIILKEKLPQSILTTIDNAISSYVISKQLSPANFKRNVPIKQRLLIKGIILLHESKFSTQIKLPNIVEQIFEAVFDKGDVQVRVVDTFDETFKSYFDSMLQLAFFSEVEKKKLVECLFNSYPVNVLNSYNATVCGKYFFELFKETIISNFLLDFNLFLNTALEQNRLELTIDYIIEFLLYIGDNTSSVPKEITKGVCVQILESWSKLQQYFKENFLKLQQGCDFIKRLACIVPFPVSWIGKSEYGIANFIIDLLVREDFGIPFEVLFNFRSQIYELLPCVSGMFDEENVALRLVSWKLANPCFI